MKSFTDRLFGKEIKEINLDKLDYFNEIVKNDIANEINKCNYKAEQYLKKHGTTKGFFCQFELRNCLDKDENKEAMKTFSSEIKQIHNWIWIANCERITGKNYGGSTTVWDASSHFK
jgi:hypothetical protein